MDAIKLFLNFVVKVPVPGIVIDGEPLDTAPMHIRAEMMKMAPARAVWDVVGEQFGEISGWTSSIVASSTDGPPGVGCVRTCRIAGVGPFRPGTVRERLLEFDRDRRTLRYGAADGMPSFVVRATNRWTVDALNSARSVVRMHATLTIRRWTTPATPLLRWQLGRAGRRTLADLRRHVASSTRVPRSGTGATPTVRR